MPERNLALPSENILAQDAQTPPVITTDNAELEVVDSFTYLGSTVSSKASLDFEISVRIAKAAGVRAKLNNRLCREQRPVEREVPAASLPIMCPFHTPLR